MYLVRLGIQDARAGPLQACVFAGFGGAKTACQSYLTNTVNIKKMLVLMQTLPVKAISLLSAAALPHILALACKTVATNTSCCHHP